MSKKLQTQLSRRERQIMDVVYKYGQATAAEVLDNMPKPPSYSAVRAMLRILEDKGFLKHKQDGPRYVYSPTIHRDKARRSALRHLVETLFQGSTVDTAATLLDMSGSELSESELDRLADVIKQVRMQGR
jgi:BlaI family transcriptional regulator, penicillinase repressor